MKVTKFVHSCVLVEDNGTVILFDPGAMSAESLKVDELKKLDGLVITHEHPDHMHVPLIKEILAKFPDVPVVTTKSAAAQLKEQGVTAQFKLDGTADLTLFAAPHEPVPGMFGPAPENIGVHYKDQFSHPGDSHSFKETKRVLAMPMAGPWGSMTRAVELAEELKPEAVLPIHDWHLHEAARTQAYDMCEAYFKHHGIRFLKPVDGQAIDV